MESTIAGDSKTRWRMESGGRLQRTEQTNNTESYLLPKIEEILSKLRGAKNFSKIDLTEGFWNIRLAKESIHYTGFAVKGGSYVEENAYGIEELTSDVPEGD